MSTKKQVQDVQEAEEVQTEEAVQTEEVKTAEVQKTEEVQEAQKAQEVKATMAINVSPTAKIGVARFLQIHPQPSGVARILKTTYKSQTKTEAEWLEIIDNMLKRSTN